ncbi:MAG TPA: dienelactone hydrolase family protein, partial [Vicinamibacterales bacterium]|nr:dienelactone hydrolase family protein [Vicinamibacterales bacterium]
DRSHVMSEWTEISVDDGTSMRAYVARPAGSATRGLLVFQEAFGVNSHIREVAERFAGEGFLAIAPELFHRTSPGFDCPYSEFATAMPHLNAVTERGLEADARAAYAWLGSAGVADNSASAGYCLGGRVSFIANSAMPLKAAVSYYGGRIPTVIHRAPALSAPMLFFWGGLDHHIPEEQRHAVIDGVRRADKVFVDVLFSNADHGFFCDARPSYHAPSAAQAWSLTLAFLNTYCPRA